MFALTGSAQEIGNNDQSAANQRYNSVDHYTKFNANTSLAYNRVVTPKSFKRRTQSSNIKSRTFKNLSAVAEGFYIVSGVFSNLDNAKNLAQKLEGEGFKSGFISNPENGLNYVYLQKYSSLERAIASCNSKLNGRYTDAFWLMNVDNGGQSDTKNTKEDLSISISKAENTKKDTPVIQEAYKLASNEKQNKPKEPVSVEEVTYEILSGAAVADTSTNIFDIKKGSVSSSVGNKPNASKLIQKADQYFEKMWYAEAAKLYEQALNKSEKNYSLEILPEGGGFILF